MSFTSMNIPIPAKIAMPLLLTKPIKVSFQMLMTLAVASVALSAEYEVGNGKKFTSIGQVPWQSLAAGDHVRIHWREKPYHEKWVLCCRGTEAQPIVISGVPGPKGQLPVIDGRDATTSDALNYWGQERGVLKIGGSNQPADRMPAHLVVENLDICGGRKPFTFAGRRGVTAYSKDAASINVEKVEHLILRNLVLHDSSNGLMVSPQSSDVLVEKCSFFDNGNEGSITEHNTYTESNGMVFQGNNYGPLRKGCNGNNLKDRSAGLVIRYNWIESGNRQLDLVDSYESPAINSSPNYRKTLVYGNTFIEREGDGNNQIVHYGGDSGKAKFYRKGTLHFYHNTVISSRQSSTTVFRLSTADESVDCRNNVFYVTLKGRNLALMSSQGTLKLQRNWLKEGWRESLSDFSGVIEGASEVVVGEAPGFESFEKQDFHLTATSPCLGAGVPLAPELLPDHAVTRRYLPHQDTEALPAQAISNLGAY